jgi:capsid assembly protease
MKNPFGALGRLFSRSESPLVTQLFTHVMGRPLLVHPALGQQLVAGYLSGAVDAGEPMVSSMQLAGGEGGPVGTGTAVVKEIRVLTISGGLVPRPIPGLCDPGPPSYAAIGQHIDAALADDTVAAIVLRVDSPGGLASGLFDLTDHIHASRGTKPIIGVVDDMAYSAAYALVAACDEIWVTRTGGVGSVGCAAFHFSQAGYNQQIGLEVTPIYSGAHKIDFNPHFPLSDAAKAMAQTDVDGLRTLFVDSVANYRGLSTDVVNGTEAQCYSGQAGIDIGFATHLGTFGDAMASLEASLTGAGPPADDSTADAAPPADDDVPPTADADESADDEDDAQDQPSASTLQVDVELDPEMTSAMARGQLAVAAAASSLPSALQVALIKRPLKADQSPAEAVAYASAVQDLCAAAGPDMETLAASFITNDTQLDAVRAQLLAVKAEDGPELQTSPPPGVHGGGANAGRWAATIHRFGGK